MTPDQQLQLQTAYIGGGALVLAALIALFGVLRTQRNQSKTRESEDERWHLNYPLQKRNEALNDLYAALANYSLDFPVGVIGFTKDYYWQKIWPTHNALVKARAMALIYLDEAALELTGNIEQDIVTVSTMVLTSRKKTVSFESTLFYERAEATLAHFRILFNLTSL